MDDILEKYAQKAGEAFVAAGRAATPEQRGRHRQSAESYQQLVSSLRSDTAPPAARSGRGQRKG